MEKKVKTIERIKSWTCKKWRSLGDWKRSCEVEWNKKCEAEGGGGIFWVADKNRRCDRKDVKKAFTDNLTDRLIDN